MLQMALFSQLLITGAGAHVIAFTTNTSVSTELGSPPQLSASSHRLFCTNTSFRFLHSQSQHKHMPYYITHNHKRHTLLIIVGLQATPQRPCLRACGPSLYSW
jgi:hypothetical protein